MNIIAKLTLLLPVLACALAGCTSFIIQRQGKLPPEHYRECPSVYALSRMEWASLEWAFSGEPKPEDPCLRHYFKKADQDGFYRDSNQYMVPLYLLSLPMDATLDTIVLPFTAAGALMED